MKGKLAPDVDKTTEVVAVNSNAEVREAIKKSGPGGSKVFLGHAFAGSEEAVGLNTGSRKMMDGPSFGEAVAESEGEAVCMMCLGGTLSLDKEGKKKAKGPKKVVTLTPHGKWTKIAKKGGISGNPKRAHERHVRLRKLTLEETK